MDPRHGPVCHSVRFAFSRDRAMSQATMSISRQTRWHEYGRPASPVKAGLRPPPSAAGGLDSGGQPSRRWPPSVRRLGPPGWTARVRNGTAYTRILATIHSFCHLPIAERKARHCSSFEAHDGHGPPAGRRRSRCHHSVARP